MKLPKNRVLREWNYPGQVVVPPSSLWSCWWCSRILCKWLCARNGALRLTKASTNLRRRQSSSSQSWMFLPEMWSRDHSVHSPESRVLNSETWVLSPHFSVRCGRSSEGCPPSRSCFTTGHRQQQSLSSESLPFYQPRNTRFTSIRKQAFEALNMEKLV